MENLVVRVRQKPLAMAMAMAKGRRAAVVVLGDFGRSPRMQYHTLSLARQAGMEVDVVAYTGTEPHAAVLEHPGVHLHLIKPPTIIQGLPRLLYLLALPVKVLVQLVHLVWLLLIRIPTPDVFLVQNPPSIPVLAVLKWACWIRKSVFIIDWHNFGYTLLGLTLSPSHLFVKLYLWYEKHYGKMADGNLCVTKAMQHELAQNWGIRATVVYDRSPEFFRPATLEEKHELFTRLDDSLRKPLGIVDCCCAKAHENQDMIMTTRRDPSGSGGRANADRKSHCTLFTCQKLDSRDHDSNKEIQEGDKYFHLKGRPALIVSSTSWTADEDFGILLEAAVMYDRRVAALLGENDSGNSGCTKSIACPFPRLLFIVTGKGPLREMYEERIGRLRLRRVAFRTMWLSAEDYPLLLGSADLGVSLHTSSSGLDLPMKVVDMFGCGLPVTAVSYSCIGELVKDRQNGLLFSSSSELADQFMELFKGFPDECQYLKCLKDGALATGLSARWADEWEEQVLPLLCKVVSPNS